MKEAEAQAAEAQVRLLERQELVGQRLGGEAEMHRKRVDLEKGMAELEARVVSLDKIANVKLEVRAVGEAQ